MQHSPAWIPHTWSCCGQGEEEEEEEEEEEVGWTREEEGGGEEEEEVEVDIVKEDTD